MKLLRPPTSPTTADSVQLELPLLAPEASSPTQPPDAPLLAPPRPHSIFPPHRLAPTSAA